MVCLFFVVSVCLVMIWRERGWIIVSFMFHLQKSLEWEGWSGVEWWHLWLLIQIKCECEILVSLLCRVDPSECWSKIEFVWRICSYWLIDVTLKKSVIATWSVHHKVKKIMTCIDCIHWAWIQLLVKVYWRFVEVENFNYDLGFKKKIKTWWTWDIIVNTTSNKRR